MYNIRATILILSLFVHIRFITPLVIIRPFDLLTVIIFLFLLSVNKEKKEEISPGFFYLLPFLIFHSFSASLSGTNNFFRETIQVILIIMFGYIISNLRFKIDYKKVIYYLLIGSAFLMILVIMWHINNDIWVGWKKLPDARIIFTVISIFLFSYLNTIEIYPKQKSKIIMMFVGFFIILLLSGERKAILIFLFLLLMYYTYGFTFRALIGAIVAYYILFFIANNTDNEYMARILNSLIKISEPGEIDFILQAGNNIETSSYSNVQRIFAFNVSKELFLENPIIGIGTNNFISILDDRYSRLPNYLRGGIHSEFLRILVENGLIGLFLYLLIWFKSWTRTKKILIMANRNGLIKKKQVVFLLYGIYLTLALYVGTEASSNRSFIILVLVSFLPDYLINHFKKNISR
jgi:hypothetical protein